MRQIHRPVGVVLRDRGHRQPPHVDGFVEVGQLPGPLEPGPQATTEVQQVSGPLGMGLWACGHRQPPHVDRLIEVGQLPGPPESSPEFVTQIGQVHRPVGVVSRCCSHGLPAKLDRLVQVGQLAGSPEPQQQPAAKVRQPACTARMVLRGRGYSLLGDRDRASLRSANSPLRPNRRWSWPLRFDRYSARSG